MKHDTKQGWCCCGEFHGADESVPHLEVEDIPPEEMSQILRRKEFMVPDTIHRAASELGQRGGLKGGAARARALSPERRSEIARKAAKSRWGTE